MDRPMICALTCQRDISSMESMKYQQLWRSFTLKFRRSRSNWCWVCKRWCREITMPYGHIAGEYTKLLHFAHNRAEYSIRGIYGSTVQSLVCDKAVPCELRFHFRAMLYIFTEIDGIRKCSNSLRKLIKLCDTIV